MTRFLRWSALLILTLPWLGVTAQEKQDPKEREERIRRRITEALDGELKHLRESLVETVLAATATGPDKALGLVTEELLHDQVTYLSSDELEGRNAGYPGNDKACEYIEKVMKKAGLKPAGDKTESGAPTYFQHFNVFGRRTQNCLGLLEGTDPGLRDELVVIGAHHDHVGTDDQNHMGRLGRARPDDTIWNGADDNGSGTSTVLGLIKAFGEGGIHTKRPILFMTFSGEEGGLLGSAYYVHHPILPIEQHVFMLNMDMVGRNPERPCEIMGVGSAEGSILRDAAEEAVRKTGLNSKIKEKSDLMGGDSDHTSFKNMGVPITFFFTGLHADYHKVTDTADKLDYPNMVRVARTAADMLIRIADAPKRPVFKGKVGNDFNFGEFTNPPPQRRVLGISKGADLEDAELDKLDLKPGEGALKVETVSPDGAAEKAGIAVGDLILSLGARKVSRSDPLATLREAINAAEPGKEVEVVVLRDRERKTLKVKWSK